MEASLGQDRQSSRERGGRGRACSAIGTQILKDFPPETISLLLEGKMTVILPMVYDINAASQAWHCSSHSSGLAFAPHSKTMPSSPLLSSLPSFLQGWFTLTPRAQLQSAFSERSFLNTPPLKHTIPTYLFHRCVHFHPASFPTEERALSTLTTPVVSAPYRILGSLSVNTCEKMMNPGSHHPCTLLALALGRY